MKAALRKTILILLFSTLAIGSQFAKADGPPPPTDCAFCDELAGTEGVSQTEVDNCRTANNCPSGVSIDGTILILFTVALSFGAYTIYKTNKKTI